MAEEPVNCHAPGSRAIFLKSPSMAKRTPKLPESGTPFRAGGATDRQKPSTGGLSDDFTRGIVCRPG